MSDTAPPIIVLKDLESIASQFVCARPFRFSLKEFPDETFEISIKPLTDAQLAKAREFTQLSPPKKKVQRRKEGSPPAAGQPVEMEEVEEEDFLDPDFLKEVNEKSAQRRAYVFQQCLPDIKFKSEQIQEIIAEIAAVFPEPYSAAIEKEIFRRSQSELAIINLANFSASAG